MTSVSVCLLAASVCCCAVGYLVGYAHAVLLTERAVAFARRRHAIWVAEVSEQTDSLRRERMAGSDDAITTAEGRRAKGGAL
jgi:hypothetical protein